MSYGEFTIMVTPLAGGQQSLVSHQLQKATAYGQAPRYLLFDNDSKYGTEFAKVAA